MVEQIKKRLIDVVTVIVVMLIFWAVYSGFIVMRQVGAFYANQCSIVQEQALKAAVERELALAPQGPIGAVEEKE